MQETTTDSLRRSVDSVLEGLGSFRGQPSPAPDAQNPWTNKLPQWGSGT